MAGFIANFDENIKVAKMIGTYSVMVISEKIKSIKDKFRTGE